MTLCNFVFVVPSVKGAAGGIGKYLIYNATLQMIRYRICRGSENGYPIAVSYLQHLWRMY